MSDRAVSPTDFNPDFSFDAPSAHATHAAHATHGSNSDIEPAANMPPRPTKQPTHKVPFTISSVLPKCDYKEEWEPKERRTDAYLSIQTQILQYLNVHAADQLTVAQAHFFFENSGTAPHGPTAKQATELTYFMRSWGFDVYAKLVPAEDKIRLYIANRSREDRDHDHLFWDQNLRTGEIVPMSDLSGGQSGPPAGFQRRPAMGNIFQWAL